MEAPSITISLEKLAKKPYPVLVDTSVIMNCLKNQRYKTLEKRNLFFLNTIEKCVKEEGNFYFTSRVIDEFSSELCDLIILLQDHDRIFELNNEREKNVYRDLYRKFAYLMKNDIMGNNVLSETDFDFSMKGLSKAKKTSPILFFSNDLKIYHAIKDDILKKEYFPYKIEFVIRRDFYTFVKILDSFVL